MNTEDIMYYADKLDKSNRRVARLETRIELLKSYLADLGLDDEKICLIMSFLGDN